MVQYVCLIEREGMQDSQKRENVINFEIVAYDTWLSCWYDRLQITPI
jgi:hypothetical protein